ncbi:MAG TPA: RNA polymerase factor sigma-54, partial [Rhodanobacter sp.]|nr:RNA polymerase factor sigma-54 [Rhodanobacter sp.]
MKPALQFRLHQQLTLTPQLQQAIRLLQLSQLELEAELRQIAESNPLLEFAEENEDADDSDGDGIEAEYASVTSSVAEAGSDGDGGSETISEWTDGGGVAESPIDFSSNNSSVGNSSSAGSHSGEDFEPQNAAPETLQQHLLWQLNMASFNPRQHGIAAVLIDALNAAGYLTEGLEAILAVLPAELHASVEEIDAVRRRLQGFDPIGVGSLDLHDCLRVQLEQFDPDTPQRELALRIVDSELELLARNDIARLARRLHAGEDDVAAAAVLIRSLDPRPGAALDTTPVEYVAPDVYAVRDGSRWRVSLNADCQPRLGLNQHYCGLIAQARGEDASWMRGQLQEARWLIKSLESRAETLLKV